MHYKGRDSASTTRHASAQQLMDVGRECFLLLGRFENDPVYSLMIKREKLKAFLQRYHYAKNLKVEQRKEFLQLLGKEITAEVEHLLNRYGDNVDIAFIDAIRHGDPDRYQIYLTLDETLNESRKTLYYIDENVMKLLKTVSYVDDNVIKLLKANSYVDDNVIRLLKTNSYVDDNVLRVMNTTNYIDDNVNSLIKTTLHDVENRVARLSAQVDYLCNRLDKTIGYDSSANSFSKRVAKSVERTLRRSFRKIGRSPAVDE